jgi:hypothetical protein
MQIYKEGKTTQVNTMGEIQQAKKGSVMLLRRKGHGMFPVIPPF